MIFNASFGRIVRCSAGDDRLDDAERGQRACERFETLLEEDPSLIPAQHACLQAIALKRFQRTWKAHRLGGNHRPPFAPPHPSRDAGADHQVDAAEIHHGEVPAVIHVQIEIEVVRPHPQGQFRGFEHIDPRPQQRGDDDTDQAKHKIHD
jgi:hypothetical protein